MREVARLRWAAVAVGIGGAIAIVVSASRSAMGTDDALTLTTIAGGAALAGGLATALALRWLRRAPLVWQIALVACIPVSATLCGTWLGARAMFFSSHDQGALVVLLIAGGTVGCVSALVLGARISRTSAELLAATRQLGEVDGPEPYDGGGPGELARLATELHATSARLDEARRRERALESSRRELIAWVSHDLRTPLAGIRAIAEALEDGIVDDSPTLARYHKTLRVEADRLSDLVDDLFELSKAQSGVISLERERLSLGDLLSDAIAGIGPVAAAKGVRVEGRSLEAPVDLEGSSPELLRALGNILENAVRHTPADGSIIVDAGVDDDAAFVTILDSGGGIPEGELGRVFDVGFRGDPARTPGEGTGLGLAIAHELVKAHRGEISVSNENGGARFTLRLPVDDAISAIAARSRP